MIVKVTVCVYLFILFIFAAFATGKSDVSVPIAEVLFYSYNPSIGERKVENGKKVKDIVRVLTQENHPVAVRSVELQEERDSKGFCFVSVGCWGGNTPHAERQVSVRNHLMELLENGISLVGDKFIDPKSADSSAEVFPVHFVLAAGDNVYPAGVSSPDSLAFFTVFESFYTLSELFQSKQSTAASYSQSKDKNGLPSQVRRSQMIPWILTLGNHDAIQNSAAEVMYTYYSIENRGDLVSKWKKELTSTGLHLEDGIEPAPSNRWYMPQNYFSMKVSDDMVVVVLDAPQLHRCAVFKQRLANAKEMEDREASIKATAEDCELADQQKEKVEHWLLRVYAHLPFKVVMSHYPLMANGPHENYPFLVEWLDPLLVKSCAVLYVNADNHYLQVSHGDLLYYANSGAGAGNKGRLHSRDKRKSWNHPRSVFQAVQGGYMIHCNVKNDKGHHFSNYVIGEEGSMQFSFSIDLRKLQECRGTATAIEQGRRRGRSLILLWLAKKLGGLVLIGAGGRFYSLRQSLLADFVSAWVNSALSYCLNHNTVKRKNYYSLLDSSSAGKDKVLQTKTVQRAIASIGILMGLVGLVV